MAMSQLKEYCSQDVLCSIGDLPKYAARTEKISEPIIAVINQTLMTK